MSEGLGHSNKSIKQNLYTDVRRTLHDQANDAAVRLLPEKKRTGESAG